MKPTLRRLACALGATLTLLAGCSSQELYSQLSERQANEMVAVLRSVGIEAEKRSQEGRFSVLTASADFPQAVRALSAQGYPREQFDSMGTVFKREGFVSSPLEERARLVHALSQEISNTVASIDGVVAARVHLVVPERNPLSDKVQPAAASVFIKHRPEKDFSPQVAQIKALVVNSIEGLPYDNVTVALFAAEALPIGPKGGPAAPATSPASQAGVMTALPMDVPMLAGSAGGAVLLLCGGLMWWRRRSTGHTMDDDATRPPSIAATPATPMTFHAGSTPSATPRPRSREELQAALRRAAGQQR